MSLSSRAVASLIRKAQHQYEQASMMLARTDQAIATGSQTKATLDQFVQERATQARSQTGTNTGAVELRINSSFSNKLRRAVNSQQSALDELIRSRQTNLASLAAAQQHLKTLESLQTRLHRAQIRIELLAEQRQNDEFSARLAQTSSVWTEK